MVLACAIFFCEAMLVVPVQRAVRLEWSGDVQHCDRCVRTFRETYKANGVTTPCPVGTYSVAGDKTTSACDNQCSAGYYCLAGSTTSSGAVGTTGAATPCPLGSYSTGGASTAACTACPAGTYGSDTTLTTAACSGNCAAGYFCPAGSKDNHGRGRRRVPDRIVQHRGRDYF